VAQALIKGYSKSKYYDPSTLDEHLPDTNASIHDEIGLVHSIAVKVSAHICKDLLKFTTHPGALFCQTKRAF